MAKSSTSMLSFFAVLLALKHVAGMREPLQAASMVETEPWWGKDQCEKFGAKKKSWWQSNICQCPKELPLPRNCEGTSGHAFNLKQGMNGAKNLEIGANVQRCTTPPRNAASSAAPTSPSPWPSPAAAVCRMLRPRSAWRKCRSRPRRCASARPWWSRAMKKTAMPWVLP